MDPNTPLSIEDIDNLCCEHIRLQTATKDHATVFVAKTSAVTPISNANSEDSKSSASSKSDKKLSNQINSLIKSVAMLTKKFKNHRNIRQEKKHDDKPQDAPKIYCPFHKKCGALMAAQSVISTPRILPKTRVAKRTRVERIRIQRRHQDPTSGNELTSLVLS